MANDHYVPQFYLKAFEAVQGKIWCYERGVRPARRGIRSVASQENYDDLKNEIPGIGKDVFAKLFRDIETKGAPIIKQLLSAPKIDQSKTDFDLLVAFVAISLSRTPYHRERLMNLHMVIDKEMAKLFCGDKERYHQTARKYAKEAGLEYDPEEVEKSRLLTFDEDCTLEYEPNEAADYFAGFALDLVDEIILVLQNKHWSLLESKTSKVFVTSDNPVVLIPPPEHAGPLGVGLSNGIIAIPISPKRCILLVNVKGPNPVTFVSRESVAEINYWTIQRAHKQVFANLRSEDVRVLFDKTTQGHNTRVRVEGGLTRKDFPGS